MAETPGPIQGQPTPEGGGQPTGKESLVQAVADERAARIAAEQVVQAGGAYTNYPNPEGGASPAPTPEGGSPTPGFLNEPFTGSTQAAEVTGQRARIVNKGTIGVPVPDLIPGVGDLGFYPEWKWPEQNAEQFEEMRRGVREYVKAKLDVKDTADLDPKFKAGMEAALEAMKAGVAAKLEAARGKFNEGQYPTAPSGPTSGPTK